MGYRGRGQEGDALRSAVRAVLSAYADLACYDGVAASERLEAAAAALREAAK